MIKHHFRLVKDDKEDLFILKETETEIKRRDKKKENIWGVIETPVIESNDRKLREKDRRRTKEA